MARRALVGENLVVVAAGRGLVAEEVDRLVGNAVGLLGLVLEVAQAVGLVPTVGEDVKGDLAPNGEAIVGGGEASGQRQFPKKERGGWGLSQKAWQVVTYVRPR